MFIRFRETSTRLQVSLVETRRVNGRVCHEHVLDRGYGRPGEASEEPKAPQQEGMFIEPFRKPNANNQGKPVRLEDFRSRTP
jgi:hypothetical protein